MNIPTIPDSTVERETIRKDLTVLKANKIPDKAKMRALEARLFHINEWDHRFR